LITQTFFFHLLQGGNWEANIAAIFPHTWSEVKTKIREQTWRIVRKTMQ
jgi:hypothetical protein